MNHSCGLTGNVGKICGRNRAVRTPFRPWGVTAVSNAASAAMASRPSVALFSQRSIMTSQPPPIEAQRPSAPCTVKMNPAPIHDL